MNKKEMLEIISQQKKIIEEFPDKMELKNEALGRMNRSMDEKSAEALGMKVHIETLQDQLNTFVFRAGKYQEMYIEAHNGWLYYEQRNKK